MDSVAGVVVSVICDLSCSLSPSDYCFPVLRPAAAALLPPSSVLSEQPGSVHLAVGFSRLAEFADTGHCLDGLVQLQVAGRPFVAVLQRHGLFHLFVVRANVVVGLLEGKTVVRNLSSVTVTVTGLELHSVPALGASGSVVIDGGVGVGLQVTGHNVVRLEHSPTRLGTQQTTATAASIAGGEGRGATASSLTGGHQEEESKGAGGHHHQK